MNVNFDSRPIPAEPQELARLEESLGRGLPAAYATFLTEFGGGPLALNEYVGATEAAGDISVRRFFTAAELADPQAWWTGRVPEDFLPVADSAGGNLIYLALGQEDQGSIYFWDHNWEAEEDESPDMRNMTVVATDFTDFLDNLRASTLDGPEPKGTGWIDPDFAREIKGAPSHGQSS